MNTLELNTCLFVDEHEACIVEARLAALAKRSPYYESIYYDFKAQFAALLNGEAVCVVSDVLSWPRGLRWGLWYLTGISADKVTYNPYDDQELETYTCLTQFVDKYKKVIRRADKSSLALSFDHDLTKTLSPDNYTTHVAKCDVSIYQLVQGMSNRLAFAQVNGTYMHSPAVKLTCEVCDALVNWLKSQIDLYPTAYCYYHRLCQVQKAKVYIERQLRTYR